MNKTDSCTFEPFKVIQAKLIVEMLVSILHCKAMYCYRRILPSMFTRQTCRILHRCESDEQGSRETFLRFIKSKNRALYLETTSGYLEKHKSNAQSFRESGCNIVDCGVPGMSLSTAPQQDEQRQHTVAKLIEKFESHQHKEHFLKDMSQTQKINRFSEVSQKLLQDMDQTEIFELCGNSTKLQCFDCNSFTEIGII